MVELWSHKVSKIIGMSLRGVVLLMAQIIIPTTETKVSMGFRIPMALALSTPNTPSEAALTSKEGLVGFQMLSSSCWSWPDGLQPVQIVVITKFCMPPVSN